MVSEEDINRVAQRLQHTKGQQSHTPEEIARELSRQLGPEYVSYRKAGGPTPAPYLEGHRAIQLANEVFGFDGWSSEIKERKLEHINSKGGIQVCCSLLMRVTLANGSFREDIGYGTVPRGSSIVSDLEKAGKEAATDALKRVLRQFGDVLGNCLYDKTYTSQLKAIPSYSMELDVDNLKRPKRKHECVETKQLVREEVKKHAKEPPKQVSPALSKATPKPPAARTAAPAHTSRAPVPIAQSTPAETVMAYIQERAPPPPDILLSSSPPDNTEDYIVPPMRPPAITSMRAPANNHTLPAHIPAPEPSSPPVVEPPQQMMESLGFVSGRALEEFNKTKELPADASFDVSVNLGAENLSLRQDKSEAAKRL